MRAMRMVSRKSANAGWWHAHALALAVTVLAVTTAASPRAAAQGADKAVAEALFDRGLTLMRQGKFAEACGQLEQSQAIERGIGTLLYLAECYEKLGKTASAWATFREAASAARAENQADRARAGAARADRLEPLLSRLTIHVTETALSAAPGLTVRRNGQVLPQGAFGVALPADPGVQQIEASAPGHLPWSASVTLPGNGGSLSVDVPELALAPVAAPQPMAATPPPAGELTPGPAAAPAADLAFTPPAHDTPSWQRPLGIVLGGAGVVAIGVGAFFGARAISKNNDLENACPRTECASANRPLQSSADSAATLSTAFWIGGAALLGAGAVVFFTAPSAPVEASVQAFGNGAQLRLHGVF